MYRIAARTCLFGLLALAVSGCDNVLDDDDDTSQVRTINLIEDAPTVRFSLGETGIGDVAFMTGTPFGSSPTGAQNVSVAVLAPPELPQDDDDGDGDDAENDDDADDDPIAIGQSLSQTLEKDVQYTFIAYGTVAAPQLLMMQGTGLAENAPDNSMVWQFINARPAGSPAVDVYVVAVEAQITTPKFVSNLAPGGATTPEQVALFPVAGADDDDPRFADVIIELREVGTGTVLYRSNESRVPETGRVTFAIMSNIGPGPSPYRVAQFAGGSGTGASVLAQDEMTGVRVAQISSDTPPFSVYPNTTLADPLAENVAFRAITPYVNVTPGEVGLIARPTSSPTDVLFLEEFNSVAAGRFTAYAVGPFSEVDAVVLPDGTRPQKMRSLFRFFNAAPSFKDQDGVDIYLTEPGEPLEFDNDGDNVDEDPTPVFRGVLYQTSAGTGDYTALKPGDYDVHFTKAGTNTVVLGSVRMNLADGWLQTFVLIDNESALLELVPVTDAMPAP